MNIAFTTKGENWDSKMDPRFGRAAYFVILNEDTKELKVVDKSDIEQEAHGAGPKAVTKLAELKADVLITGNGPGGNAATIIEKLGIVCYIGAGEMSMQEAYDAYRNEKLNRF